MAWQSRPMKISRKRKAWAAPRSATLKGHALMPPVAVSVRYAARLRSLVKRLTDETSREVRSLFEGNAASAHFGQDASISSQARILMNSLRDKFEALFAQAAKPTAETMVNGAKKASGTALHSSLTQISGGLSLKTHFTNDPLVNIYKASVTENVNLIKSIASQYLKQVEGSVMRSITTGNGMQDLQPALAQYQGQTERRAELMALDQTRKAFTSINKGRMQAIGLKKFEWIHSGGGMHPRQDHVDMDGEIFSFDNLPVIDQRTGERGIPGQAVNCRCTMTPVFDFTPEE